MQALALQLMLRLADKNMTNSWAFLWAYGWEQKENSDFLNVSLDIEL